MGMTDIILKWPTRHLHALGSARLQLVGACKNPACPSTDFYVYSPLCALYCVACHHTTYLPSHMIAHFRACAREAQLDGWLRPEYGQWDRSMQDHAVHNPDECCECLSTAMPGGGVPETLSQCFRIPICDVCKGPQTLQRVIPCGVPTVFSFSTPSAT